MGDMIQLSARLVLDLILLVGLVTVLGHLYRFCRNTPKLKLDLPVRAKLATVLGACLCLWLLARGFKGDINGFCDLLSFVAFVGIGIVGISEIWQRRGALQDELRKRFPA